MFDLFGHLFGQTRRGCAVLFRILEKAASVQLSASEEPFKKLDVLVRLAGKADDERAAHRVAAAGGEFCDKCVNTFAVDAPVHPLQHLVAVMLQRYVEIAADLGMRVDEIEQLVRDLFGIEIEQSYPLDRQLA